MNTIKQHEKINLHIKKRTFYCILFSLILSPIIGFIIWSQFIIMSYAPNDLSLLAWRFSINSTIIILGSLVVIIILIYYLVERVSK